MDSRGGISCHRFEQMTAIPKQILPAARSVPAADIALLLRGLAAVLLAGTFLPVAPVQAQMPPWQAPPRLQGPRIAARSNRHARIIPQLAQAPADTQPVVEKPSDRLDVEFDPGYADDTEQYDTEYSDAEYSDAEYYGPEGVLFDEYPVDGYPEQRGYAGGDYWNDPMSDRGFAYTRYLLPFHRRLWARGEYLLWWTQGTRPPALVTTSPQGTPQNQAGVLGQTGTSVLFGQNVLNDNTRSGGRITLGYWLDPCRGRGVEVTFLGIGNETTRYHAISKGDPILARPFYNIVDGNQDAHLIAFPGLVEGSIAVRAMTDFQSVEVLRRRVSYQQGNRRSNFVFGYRYSRLEDDLVIDEHKLLSGGIVPAGTTIDVHDSFDTRNEFHGAKLGVITQMQRNRWSLELLMKLALGNTHSRVIIDGSTVVEVPGVAAENYEGGLLALPTNIGEYHENQFAVIPELGITLGYQLTCRLRATFGYTFIYWSRVARPGDQIDLDLNPSYFPPPAPAGPARPEFTLVTTDFWAQGLNFGLEYRF